MVHDALKALCLGGPAELKLERLRLTVDAFYIYMAPPLGHTARPWVMGVWGSKVVLKIGPKIRQNKKIGSADNVSYNEGMECQKLW